MVKCNKCGVDIDDSLNQCPNCGNDLTKVPNSTNENVCGNCGNTVSEGIKFCPTCGFEIEKNISDKRKCSYCGFELEDNLKFCPSCGNKIEQINNVKKCSTCGTILEDDEDFCHECGNPINNTIKTIHCVNCGSKINANLDICPKCGNNSRKNNQVNTNKKPVVALILSFFITGLGHFYLHLNKKGLILFIASLIAAILQMSLYFQFVLMIIFEVLFLLIKIYSMYDAYKCNVALLEGKTVEDKFSFED